MCASKDREWPNSAAHPAEASGTGGLAPFWGVKATNLTPVHVNKAREEP
ncbi:hypothetical protein [Paenibacillus roseipurpureus]|uniref:Uncharacterized protein n=1 Tax=Paenibacillus roseopurpureus TaxID=2918901 RepID=A0AA96LMT4_9BACL|nr:hypothetical protein [Paenibacillus sp. MBLB1832]WNR44007.1 hypothetical protein MJB10_23400 [Paenibacillus sp. MBLB1832]